jgi:hypothetical protein
MASDSHKQWIVRKEEIVSRNGLHLITRWRLNTPLGYVFLHKMRNADVEPDLHDHPWPFLSFIVHGGYIEKIPSGLRHWRRWSSHRMKATDMHRIVDVEPHTWTLLLTGTVKRKWGFLTDQGWVRHDTYMERYESQEESDSTAKTTVGSPN